MPIKILVVCNSAPDLSTIRSALSACPLIFAGSVAEAKKTLSEKQGINLLLLDLCLKDGLRMLEDLRDDERFRDLRTIILTDSDDSESEIAGLKLGAVDYVRKPLNEEALKVRIKANVFLERSKKTFDELFLGWENGECETLEEALQASERSKSVFLHHLPGLAYRCDFDREWTMRYVSEGCYNLTGYHPESLLNNRDLSYNDLISPEYHEILWDCWNEVLRNKIPFKYEYEIITASGEKKWVIEMGQGIFDENGEVEALEGIVLDISDRKAVEDALKYSIEHDRWTGLYNRDYLEKLFEEQALEGGVLKRAFVSLNLSTVEALTARYGFHYTQGLIKKASEKLNEFSTEQRILFQPNQSSFLFYVLDYRDKEELFEFSETIAKAMEELFLMERIGGGIGVLEFDPNERDLDKLLRQVLAASERAINILEKGFSISFYDEEMEAAVNRERDIEEALNCVAEGRSKKAELFLLYQPIVDLKTGLICCFEALSRLRTDKLGIVSPLEFIPLAEKSKLIIPLGEKVLLEAFRFLNTLKERGYPDIAVSVNISVLELLNPDFTDKLFSMMEKMGIDPKNVGIEITESVFTIDYEAVNRVIYKLRDAGIYVAIDDFGIGYSSLARERELRVNCIKIDKYFINKLDEDLDRAIMGDIISMLHKLGHCIVAEGVETETQLQYLMKHNCDRVQGFFISKPLDEKAAIELLVKQKGLSVK
jgi:PAS domain S-box-containing protein